MVGRRVGRLLGGLARGGVAHVELDVGRRERDAWSGVGVGVGVGVGAGVRVTARARNRARARARVRVGGERDAHVAQAEHVAQGGP